jgi:signal transduction histidine kinase
VVVWDELPEAPIEVLAADGELQQVFSNLVSNALDALGEDGGHLRLAVSATGDTARAVVADDGPGIEPERLERIFQPFHTTKLATGGTGLGLFISQQIVRRHGGTLAAESRPGAGSRFIVELPLYRRDAEQSGRPA